MEHELKTLTARLLAQRWLPRSDRLVRRALENFRLPYITVTPTFSICPVHGYLSGEHQFCPQCDELALQRKRSAQAEAAAI